MKPPEHLSPDSKRTWRRVAKEYELPADALMLLEAALTQWDRAAEARRLIEKEGIILAGKRHPATDVEKQAASLFLRAWRQLGLDIVPPGPVGRPSS